MKNTNIKTKNNLLCFLLALAVLMASFLPSCAEENEETPKESASEVSVAYTELDNEAAISLIERDHEVMRLFVSCLLYSGSKQSAGKVEVSDNSKYSDFSEVTKLLSDTYSVSGGSIEYFLAYPGYGNPSLSQVDGKTLAAYHPGSGYNDFIVNESVSVASAGTDTAVITAKTTSGTEVRLSAVRSEGHWLLEKGLYRTVDDSDDYFESVFPFSGIGSCKSLGGKLLAVELFITEDGAGFSREEENEFHSVISGALGYLRDECDKYGNELDITYASSYYEHSGTIGSNTYAFDMMFAFTSFETLGGFIDANFTLDEYDDYVVFVCMNSSGGTDFNRYEQTAETELFDTERVFVRSDSKSGEVCSSLLQLFGAYDYSGSRCDTGISELFRSYFPQDIVITDDIGDNAISPVTAFAAGLTHNLPKLLRVFEYNAE